MKQSRRIIALIIAFALLIFAICSCSSNKGGSDAGNLIPTGVGRNDTATESGGSEGADSDEQNTAALLAADEEEAFAKTVFVGDSICSGFRTYGVMPANNNLAVGNVGARSIFDYTFRVDDEEYDLITALKLVAPTFVVFSMGMNDINMTSEQDYCDNYDGIIEKVREALPDAKLFVASITPTREAPSFTNARIDLFNEAIKAHLEGTDVTYVDVNTALKDGATNSLIASYDGGDGIHLAPEAYTVFKNIVYELYKSLGFSA